MDGRKGWTDPNLKDPSSHDRQSNKTFACPCMGLNHYITQSLFVMTLNLKKTNTTSINWHLKVKDTE